MDIPHTLGRLARFGLACAALLAVALARGADLRFSDGLSAEEKVAAGFPKLGAPQIAALDRLVARDVTLAHEGGVTGFASTFAARHTAPERAAAGIDRLSALERAALDSLAARTIALGPPPEDEFRYAPPQAPPPPPATLVSAPPHLEVHGDVSLTIGGGGHGSSFYGTSMDLFVTDPSGKFTLGVGVGEFHGKGFFGPYGPYSPVFFEPPYLGGW
jgi:hypothetical protein